MEHTFAYFYNISDIKANVITSLYEYNLDDYSLYDYPIPQKSLPLWEVIIKIVITVIVMLVAVIGNGLVIVAVIWNNRLRTTTNYYLVNLCIADLLVTSSCTWVLLVDNLSEGWILGTFFCKLNSFAQVVSLVSSILSMTLISIDRFFGIVFAVRSRVVERRARYCIVIVWICGIIVGVPQLICRKVFSRYWKNHVELWCDEEWEYPMTSRVAYWTTVSVIMFFVPSLVMLGTYGCIIRTLWMSRPPGERFVNNVQNKVKRKAVFMLLTIVTVFWVCWLPVQFSILYSEHRSNKSEIIGDWYVSFNFYARALAFSNSAMNPFIYAAFSDNFRQGFRRMSTGSDRSSSIRTNRFRQSTSICRSSTRSKLWFRMNPVYRKETSLTDL